MTSTVHAKTHVQRQRSRLTKCGIVLTQYHGTDFIGIINTRSGGYMEYAIGKCDTNELCLECSKL